MARNRGSKNVRRPKRNAAPPRAPARRLPNGTIALLVTCAGLVVAGGQQVVGTYAARTELGTSFWFFVLLGVGGAGFGASLLVHTLWIKSSLGWPAVIGMIVAVALATLLIIPPLLARSQQQSSTTSAALPFAPPKSAHDIVQISPITITPGNTQRSYTFHYDIRNDGSPACLQKVWVILHRHFPVSPVYFPDADGPAPVCMKSGTQHGVDIARTLPPGTYGYAAKWTNTIRPGPTDYNCYEGSAECDPEHDGKEFTVP